MPCRDPGPSQWEIDQRNARERQQAETDAHNLKYYHERADDLTAENDRLREALILSLKVFPKLRDMVDPLVVDVLDQKQAEHRKEDLDRLEKVFLKAKDARLLAKVWAADPALPLEGQLGFDPDIY